MMTTLVMKFGGTSTGTVEALIRASDIVIDHKERWDHIVVVVSAMAGVTDTLIECAEWAQHNNNDYRANISELRARLRSVVSALFTGDRDYEELMSLIDLRLGELSKICRDIQIQGIGSPHQMDEIAALGERINAQIFSTLLKKRRVFNQAVEATQFIVTDNCHQDASPIQNESNPRIKACLNPILSAGRIPVVTGFIGATRSGATTTLGRGGSDFSAAIVGCGLKADEVWIWKDVDGVMSADPFLIHGARLIPEISYNEILELARNGAKVLHPKSVQLLRDAKIPLWVKNTFNLPCKGTKISHTTRSVKFTVAAVTEQKDMDNLSSITIVGWNINRAPRVVSRIALAIKKTGASVQKIERRTSPHSLTFLVVNGNGNQAIHQIHNELILK